jgi:Ca2+-binding EF-hand superfamily protein
MFDALDTKKQGYLSELDLQGLLKSADDSTANAGDMIRALDTDGDGKVTKSEFSSAIDKMVTQLGDQMMQARMGRGHPPAGAPPPPKGDDAGLSKDQLSEMAAAQSSDSPASSDLNALVASFDAADANGDGKVSFSEAQAFREKTQSQDDDAARPSSSEDAARQFLRSMAQYLASASGVESGSGESGTVSLMA